MENSLSYFLSKLHSQFGCSCIVVIVRVDLGNPLLSGTCKFLKFLRGHSVFHFQSAMF